MANKQFRMEKYWEHRCALISHNMLSKTDTFDFYMKKSCIRETKNLLTDVESRTDTIVEILARISFSILGDMDIHK